MFKTAFLHTIKFLSIVLIVGILGSKILLFANEFGPKGELPQYTQIFSTMTFGDSGHSITQLIEQASTDPATNNLFPLNGNVGVGTSNPLTKLEVAGDIHAEGDVCSSNGNCLNNALTKVYSGTYHMKGCGEPKPDKFFYTGITHPRILLINSAMDTWTGGWAYKSANIYSSTPGYVVIKGWMGGQCDPATFHWIVIGD